MYENVKESFFDDLARALAEPMPRRKALRVAGAALAAVALPSVVSRPARATVRASGSCRPCSGKLVVTDEPWCKCCPAGLGCFQKCCRPGENCWPGTTGTVGIGVCCPSGQAGCGRGRPGGRSYILTGCCLPGKTCNPLRGTCCSPADFNCDQCPRGSTRCGGDCCGPGEECRGGKCVERCARERKCGGSRCCPQGTFCCDPQKRLCCQKGSDCCNTAPPGAKERWTCCARGMSCAPQLDLTVNGTTAGVPRNASRICCPSERVVPLARKVCCPPGHVSLGGKLVLPAGGGGGLCCRRDKLCGSGANVTCCSSGSATVPEISTTCCDGKCVNTRYDVRNCGGCGRTCAAGERCNSGTCVAA